jgi:hypothetical protein
VVGNKDKLQFLLLGQVEQRVVYLLLTT